MTDAALEFLRERAEKSRESAGIQLARSRSAEKQVAEQIAVLTEYRTMYRQRMQQAMLEGTSLQSVRDFQAFLTSLDSAIESARKSQAELHQEVARSASVMQERQRELSSFETVATRRQSRRAAEEARKDIKETDALATRIHTRRLSQQNGYQGTGLHHE